MPGTPLTEKQAFRYGFLLRCAEAGHDAAALAEAGVKRAEEGIGSKLIGLGGKGLVLGLTLPFAAAAGLGALGGAGVAKMRETPVDPDEVRNQELIAAYDSYARQARLRSLVRRRRPPQRPSYSRF